MDRLPNIHPGEILLEEFLVPLGISKYHLAHNIQVPATCISEICAGKRSISPDTAIRFGKVFKTFRFLTRSSCRLRYRENPAEKPT
ncbi:HigA family addiction module antitoxin [Oxalobacter formigenes]|uniref:HigA family addiction module antitoxin n=1 Tax=Oxalobacter formigenes TaxID=847 RepID=UPI000A2A257A|nr:HigA family addiction module antitoxin [Oxalobacter formigenes]ARQ45827.1 Antitoxin HigA [Oxalobacter formigenes]MCZ4062265.1 HigA family addiction module antitoxin [Oxalobacter formigenes]WAW08655.1 HigA family addiction module antitoxin [Oxalobacter formigenes]